MTFSNVLSAVGQTPLIRLSRVLGGLPFNLYGKMEGLNPGGSMKDRSALYILQNALREGKVFPGGLVVESSSGNMGIGLAQACNYFGLQFVCVVDPKTTTQNLSILRAYGAVIEMVAKPDPVTNEYLPARLQRVRDILDANEGSYWPNQYGNRWNPEAHSQHTMREIDEALEGHVDMVFCPTSTCGLVTGCSSYFRARGRSTKVIAVDALGSVIFSKVKATRRIPGMGAGKRSDLYRDGMADGHVCVSDLECVQGCRHLVGEESILAGGSSGGAVMAVDRMRDQIPAGSNCVVILCDRGERYLDTVYDDDWVEKYLGEVPMMAQEAVMA
ncbi:MAG: 2,3-diaminopropionate biosynthesis protein SbnA [Bacteroidota bacterium]